MNEAPDPSLPDLIAQCLSRLERDGEAGLDAVCAEHPGRADALRRRVAALRDAGMIAPAEPRTLGDGEFVLRDVVAAGGMGVVWRAEQRPLGRVVAVKTIRPGQLLVGDGRERFEREVATVARLHHPGIVSILTVGDDDGLPWFAMEYVDGCSLADVLADVRGREPASLSSRDLSATLERHADPTPSGSAPHWMADASWQLAVTRIVRDLLDALEHGHQQGVVHRDVKPSNVLLTRDGQVKLTDYGLARVLDASVELSRSGQQLGTPYAMSPEQVEGARDAIGPRTDVYGAGVVLYQLLTLHAPFEGDTTEALFARILAGDPRDPRRWVPSLSRDLAAIALRALERRPEDRYASAAAMSDDLSAVLDGKAPVARPLSTTRRLARRLRRQSTAARLVDALLIAALAIAVDRLFLRPGARDATTLHAVRALVAGGALLVSTWLVLPRATSPRLRAVVRAAALVVAAGLTAVIVADRDDDLRALERGELQSALAEHPRAILRPLDAFLTRWSDDLGDDDVAFAARVHLLNQRPDLALDWADQLGDDVERAAIRSVALEQLGDLETADAAEARWRDALATEPPDVDWMRVGAMLADAGHFEDALEVYAVVGRAPALRSERDLLHRRIAAAQLALGRWSEARTMIDALLPWYPDDAEVATLDARAGLAAGDWSRAEEAIARVTPRDGLVAHRLRHDLVARRDGAAAAAAWIADREDAETLPDEVVDWLAHRALSERRFDDAAALLMRLGSEASTDYARASSAYGLAAVALQRGRFDEAEDHARRGLDVGLPMYEGPFNLAQVALRRAIDASLGDVDRLTDDDWRAVAEQLEEALALNPVHVSTINNLAFARIRLGEVDGAAALLDRGVAALERRIERAPDASAPRGDLSMCLDTRVDAWLAQGDVDRARATAQRALDVLPDGHPSSSRRRVRVAELSR